MKPTKQERLNALYASGYVGLVEGWAKGCCAPVFYRDEADELHNGTMTFIKTDVEVLGLTAGHVADSLVQFCNERQGHGCQVGRAELDPALLVARHPKLDLATFRLSELFLATSGHHAATIPSWPPRALVPREPLMFCGYPGIYRKEDARNYDVSFVWFAGRADSVSDTNLGMALRIEDSLTADRERVPSNADLGGWSGGPVFSLLEKEAIARLELCGIIYEYSAVSEIVLAHPLTQVASDGTFVE